MSHSFKKFAFLLIIILAAYYLSGDSRDNLSGLVELTEEERFFLDKKDVLIVYADPDFSPISYYNYEKKEFEGISIDTLKLLSEILNFRYKIIRNKDLTWQDRLDKIKNNEADILCGASINPEREKFGYFTESEYFIVNYAFIKLVEKHIYISNLNDIKNMKIGLSEGLSINDFIKEELQNNNVFLYYKTKDEALNALKNNKIDLYPYNEAVFKEDFFNGNLFDFEIAYSIYDKKKEYCFFCPSTPEGLMLSKILDKGMKVIDINKIISYRYSHKSSFAFYKEHVKNLQKKNIIKTAGIIILFLVIVFGLIFTFLLIIESKKKEKLIRELKSLQNEVEEHSSTDRLTGLPNREIFFDRLSQIRLLSTRIKNLFAVFIMDIDAFKNINKEFGHELGDKVIIKVAERIRNCLRESDTLARTGSDEFFGILTNIQYPKDPGIVALRILESLEDPLEINKQKYKVTISIGISVFPINSQNNDELISKAHEAMIIAKRHGRNTYVFYKEKK